MKTGKSIAETIAASKQTGDKNVFYVIAYFKLCKGGKRCLKKK